MGGKLVDQFITRRAPLPERPQKRRKTVEDDSEESDLDGFIVEDDVDHSKEISATVKTLFGKDKNDMA